MNGHAACGMPVHYSRARNIWIKSKIFNLNRIKRKNIWRMKIEPPTTKCICVEGRKNSIEGNSLNRIISHYLCIHVWQWWEFSYTYFNSEINVSTRMLKLAKKQFYKISINISIFIHHCTFQYCTSFKYKIELSSSIMKFIFVPSHSIEASKSIECSWMLAVV